MRPILDPRMRMSFGAAWPLRCTIQQITFTEESSGQKLPVSAADIAGLVNLECRIAPLILLRPEDSELRESTVTELYERRQLKINAYLPQIQAHTMQAVVDGHTWQIRGVEADGQSFSTRLKLENIKP